MGLARRCACLLAGLLLSGCIIGVDLPASAPYIANCAPPINEASEGTGTPLFFVSTGLPDCRSGALNFAGLRYPRTTFGLSDAIAGEDDSDQQAFTSRAYTEETWTDLLQQQLSAGHNDGRVLVYIHGYNNSFDDALDAASRTSRAYFDGVPVVVIRWPSLASAPNYIFDEGSIAWSQARIDQTIVDLARMNARITIVAHSMGTRAAIKSVERLDQSRPDLAARVERVVLASPDIDRSAALSEGGAIDRMLSGSRQVLIYTSSRDVPLALSRDAHGYARLGSSNCLYDVDESERLRPEGTLCHLTRPHEGLAIVDTSQVASPTRFRHSDYLDSCAVRADLTAFLREENTFPLRRQIERDGKVGYWISPELAEQHAGCSEAD